MDTTIILKLLKHWLIAEATTCTQVINRLEDEGDINALHDNIARHDTFMYVFNVISDLLNKGCV